MQLADSPRKVALAFAENGDKDTIPEDSSVSPGRASMNDGFPPETRQPIGSGGIPPNGLDMNGILYYLSLLNRWQSAGGGFVYDSVFANDSDVGGYPKGAILLRSGGDGFWLNLADNNVNNPDTGGANWQPINNVGITSKTLTSSDVTLTNAEASKDIIVLSGTLTANVNLIMPVFVKQWIVANNTSGTFTVTVKTASGTGGLVTQSTSRVFYGDGTNIYGVNPLAATQSQVNTGTDTQTFLTPKTLKDSQQLADKADKNGSASNRFKVATPVDDDEAARKDQLPSLATDTQAGLVEKATLAELVAGTVNKFPDANELLDSFSFDATNKEFTLSSFLGKLSIKMGTVTTGNLIGTPDNNETTVSFTNPFPTACLMFFAVPKTSEASDIPNFWVSVNSFSASSAVVWLFEAGASDQGTGAGFNWLAIGY